MTLRHILNEFKDTKSIIPALSLGFTIGTLGVILEISFATMLYGGPLSYFAPRGASYILFGGFVLCISGCLSSSFKTMIILAQDAPIAVLAATTAYIATSTSSIQEGIATVNLLIIFACLSTGLIFILIGHFELANMVRFMPYPVIGGFLAGTGWLLAQGGLGVMADISLNLNNLSLLFTTSKLILWIPGITFAVLFIFIVLKCSHHIVLPLTLFIAIIGYFIVIWASDLSLSQAADMGIFFKNLPQGRLLPDIPAFDINLVDWNIFIKQIPVIITVIIVSIVATLLNINGIELSSKQEIDLNKELKNGGIANSIAALFGSTPGYGALSLSMLGFKTGVYSRWVGIFCALTILSVILLGSQILGIFPKPLLGAMLFMLGILFIKDWLWDARKKLDKIDYGIIWIIVLTIALFGFLQGVGLGLLLTIIILVFRLSCIPAARNIKTGSQIRSQLSRPFTEQAILKNYDKNVIFFELYGYLFFGTSTLLIQNILQRINNLPLNKPGFIILDFSNIQGVDISAINNFQRLLLKFKVMQCTLVISNPQQKVKNILDQDHNLKYFTDKEKTFQWIEEKILSLHKDFHSNQEKLEQKNLQDNLFELVADNYLIHLDKLSELELIIKEMKNITQNINLNSQEVLIKYKQALEGIYIWEWGQGEIISDLENKEQRIRGLGAGDSLSISSLSGSYPAPYQVKAISKSCVIYIPVQKLLDFEKDNPHVAAKLYRMLMLQTRQRLDSKS